LLGQRTGPVGDRIAGVSGGLAFDQQHLTFVLGDRVVARALGHHQQLAFVQLDRATGHFDAQTTR